METPSKPTSTTKFAELEYLWSQYFDTPLPLDKEWCERRVGIAKEIRALVRDAVFDYSEDGTWDIVTINGCIVLMEDMADD